MSTQMVMGNDFADMDQSLFVDADQQPQTQEVSPVPQQGENVQETQAPQPDPNEERFRRLENTIQAGQRQIQRLLRDRADVPATLTQSLQELRQEFADLKEQREFENLTLEEQNERLRQQRDAARSPKVQQQAAVDLAQIDRSSDWFVEGLTEEYTDDIVPELLDKAEDLGFNLTPEHIENLRQYALTSNDGPQLKQRDGVPYLDWRTWKLQKAYPAIKAAADAARNEASQSRRGQSPARANPAATGTGSRPSAGGTRNIDFFKSNIGDEIAAAGWGDLR